MKCSWGFLFLGANIDAIGTAARFGISADRAVNYNADSKVTRLDYEFVSEIVSCMREGNVIAFEWKGRIN